jgi:hypothetical protein
VIGWLADRHRSGLVMPEERPQSGTHCVVAACDRPAAVYVDISDGEPMDGETAVPMCDEHAAHWRNTG